MNSIALKHRLLICAALIMICFFMLVLWSGINSPVIISITGLLLALILAASIIWLLAPLIRVAREVDAIKSGKITRLGDDYPTELLPLSTNLNAFIKLSDSRLKRYRTRLDDLAHSFKTPLAVQRAAVDNETDDMRLKQIVLEQIERMDQAVKYHLKRAATHGQLSMAKQITLAPIAEKLSKAFALKYAEKSLRYELNIDTDLAFPGHQGDLLEILGNLGDNACKAAHKQIRISAYNSSDRHNPALIIEVEDDGPGIAEQQRDQVLRRGRRADTYGEGSGIGLALVSDIVEDGYQGRLDIDDSVLGGALIRVFLPL